ncbi:hypothetical protein [Actinoplanes sp. L3-i22]|uniref:hypothetical protein n=1 Tax=Actinoplanes sp. L3-i22 TaxID=2836373 RepID=UPI001C76C269|nr:hypothetical protein [Actinoplanes sp. L3-i22]BCY09073.1 hypothetical protein L3i22_041610 [Actinoplanes sp. L3-i22]
MTAQARPHISTALKAIHEARFAYRHTSAYRTLVERAGPPAREVATGPGEPGHDEAEAALRRLPLTDKEFYRSHYPAGVVAAGHPLSAERHVLISHSSGTGGDRLTTAAYTYDLARRMSRTTSVHPELRGRLLSARSQRVARYAAPNCSDVECAAPQTTMASRTLRDGTLVLPVGHDLLATSAALVDQAIEEIAAWRPDWFYTDATHFAFLLRQYRARGLPPPAPGAVVLTYTLATGVARRQIRELLGDDPPMAEVVSMSELGWVAMECPRQTLHLNAAALHPELLDPRTLAPAGPGEVGELVVTSIGDRLLPHVRYRTGDLYRRQPGCPCGSAFPAVRHEGRAAHYLLTPDGRRISPKAFDEVIGPDPAVIAYRMRQRTGRRFRFGWIPAPGAAPEAAAALCRRVEQLLGPGAELRAEAVEHLASQQTGKFLSCVRADDVPAQR